MEIPKPSRRRRPRRRSHRALLKAQSEAAKIPGPSNNPATNLLIGDIAMRGASMLLGRAIERTMLAARYDAEKAAGIVESRTLTHSLAATAAARVATRSFPGFLVISGGLLAKSLFDRTFTRRESVARGERSLRRMAEKNAKE